MRTVGVNTRRSVSLFAALLAALLAACAGDDKGADTDATTDTTGTTGTTGAPCQSLFEEIPFDGDPRFPTPTSLIDAANAAAVGAKLTYVSGGETGLLIEVAYDAGAIHVVGEDCPDTGIWGSMEIPVTMTFITDDGAFAESLPASLSADLSGMGSSISASWVTPSDLKGTFQIPATLGSHSKSDFVDLLVNISVHLYPAPLVPEGEIQAGGELSECPPEPECQYWGTVATISVG